MLTFGFTTFNGAAPARPGHAHRCAARGGAGLVIVRSHARQTLLVVHRGHCQLANRLILTIGVARGNGAVGTYAEGLILARPRRIRSGSERIGLKQPNSD